ncbi:MAG: DUF3179 domain-containing (seleno)protein, partial [Nitrososphaera sp.]
MTARQVGKKSRVMIAGGAALAVGLAAAFIMNPSLSSRTAVNQDTRSIVPADQIVSGGVQRDGIPSIDHPKFVSVQEAKLQDSDLVLGLEIGGDVRAYPLQILVWHEIVNDNVGGVPVAVTY